jgi:hypothetical protein
VARNLERALIAEWELRLLGRVPEVEVDAAARFRAAAEFAEAQGLRYQTARELAAGPLEEILHRVERLRKADPKAEDEDLAAAVLGGVEAPKLRLSELVAEVEALAAHDNRFKNAEQMRQWRRERVRAVTSLRKALGGRDPFVLDLDAGIAAHHLAWAKKEFE